MDNRRQVGPGMAVAEALGCQDGSGTAVSGALQVGHQVGRNDGLGASGGSGDRFEVGSGVVLGKTTYSGPSQVPSLLSGFLYS